MRHVRIAGVCLLAIFALTATVSASASAGTLPALWECHKLTANKITKKFEGIYTDTKCSKEATTKQKEEGLVNKFVLQEFSLAAKKNKPKEFKDLKGAGADLAIEGVATVACASFEDHGFFSGPKTANKIKVTFFGCEIAGLKCSNTEIAGKVETKTLTGELGYISGKGTEHPVVGAVIRPETGIYEAEFRCQDLHLRVHGSVIGKVEVPLKTFTTKATLYFKESGGKQSPEQFEEGVKETLITETCKSEEFCEPGGTPDPSAEEAKAINTGELLELLA